MALDPRPHAEAVKAAIRTQLGSVHAYDYDDIPGSNGNAGVLPNIFVAVSVERRAGMPLRTDATAGLTAWRVTTRSVGRTVDEARWAQLKVAQALNEARLVVGTETTTTIQFEADEAPAQDETRWSGWSDWTYTI